jgi:hypothetical protein
VFEEVGACIQKIEDIYDQIINVSASEQKSQTLTEQANELFERASSLIQKTGNQFKIWENMVFHYCENNENSTKAQMIGNQYQFLMSQFNDELENYSFEVTSVGLNSPISTQRQFLKNINKKLGIQSLSGENFKGHLCEVNDNNVKIEWISRESKIKGKGKISVKKNKSFSYNQIKQAKIIIEF